MPNVIDLLEPKFDFFDGLNSQNPDDASVSDIKKRENATEETNDDDLQSLEDDDDVLKKLFHMQKMKKQANKNKKTK